MIIIIMFPHTCNIYIPAEIQFSLLQSQYDFDEEQDSDDIRVCVNRTGEMERTIVLRTTLIEGTATCKLISSRIRNL